MLKGSISGVALNIMMAIVLSAAAFGQTNEGAPPQAGAQREQPVGLSPAIEQGAVPVAAPPVPVQEQDLLLRGAANYRQGNYEEALVDLEKVRARNPQSAIAAYYLGATLKKMQLYSKAVSHLKDAVTLQPAVNQAFLELADDYYALGRIDEALHALEVAEKEGTDPGQAAYLKGLVLMKKRNFDEARASFEKAKSLDEALAPSADFQIATIYHRLGKQAEARDLFASVADRSPDSAAGYMARQQADALAARMETKHAFNAVVNVQEQYDSNVLLKPDDSSVATDITGEADMSTVVSVHAGYALPLDLPYGVKIQYDYYLNTHQKLKTHDVQGHTIGVAPSYRIGENTLSLPISYGSWQVDKADYLKTTSLAPAYAFVTGEDQYAQASLKYVQKDYLSEPPFPEDDRDATGIGAGISWFRLIEKQKGFINVKYELDKEDAKGSNWSYLGHKLAAGILYPATSRVKLALGLEEYLQRYANTDTVFNVARDDKTMTLTAQAFYTLFSQVELQFLFVYMKDSSNIPAYAFSKNIEAIGLYARF